jgi:hypothetical protein
MSDRMPVLYTRLWDDDAFVARFREACAKAGREPAEVCVAAGLSAQYLEKARGRGGRTTEGILLLSEVLGVDPGELAFGARKA